MNRCTKLTLTLTLVLLCAMLAGCAGAGSQATTAPAAVTEAPAETAPAETAPAEAAPAKTYEDNFAVDADAAKAFAQRIQEAVAAKDLTALADLTAFPVYVGLPDVDVVSTREDFLALGADAVFTQSLLDAVKNADLDNFQPSMAGFSLSSGSTTGINFGVANGVLGITGINY